MVAMISPLAPGGWLRCEVWCRARAIVRRQACDCVDAPQAIFRGACCVPAKESARVRRHHKIVVVTAGQATHRTVLSNMDISALSERARFILDRMERDRSYEMSDLGVWVPDASVEGVREVMHELWISRHVERVGASAWRRHRSSAPHEGSPGVRQATAVKPEELFDHDTFEEFFR